MLDESEVPLKRGVETTTTTCPDCGHVLTREAWGDRMARLYLRPLLRLAPKRAACPTRIDDSSGWGTECGCTSFPHSTVY